MRVGSFWVITGVVEIGLGGRLNHHESRWDTLGHSAPGSRFSKAKVCQAKRHFIGYRSTVMSEKVAKLVSSGTLHFCDILVIFCTFGPFTIRLKYFNILHD